ncbi:MAG: hypothetical protein ACMUIP_17490 [bacterium]
MKVIAFITSPNTIYKIPDHLRLWKDKPFRDPPPCGLEDAPVEYEPLYDDALCILMILVFL